MSITKKPTINNLSFYTSKPVKEKKKQRKNKSNWKPMTLKKGEVMQKKTKPKEVSLKIQNKKKIKFSPG